MVGPVNTPLQEQHKPVNTQLQDFSSPRLNLINLYKHNKPLATSMENGQNTVNID
jgi:hypothetical protein